MGETDEKENVPAGTPTAEIETEPKETEKLLNTDEKKVEIESPTNGKETPAEETKTEEPAPEKTNGEEVIEIPDEKKPEAEEKKSKKAPFGGIKMPGLFKNKSKPAEKDDAEGELLNNGEKDAKTEEPKEETAAPQSARANFFASLPPLPSLPKFKNPFAKKAAAPKDEETGDAPTDEKTDAAETIDEKPVEKTENNDEKPEKEPLSENVGENEQAPPAAKKNLLKFPAIRLPQLSSLIPKRLQSNNQQTDDLELGNGPNNKAGLASMETLDDSIKDNDTNKDVTDRAAVQDEGLETVKLNDNDKEKEAGKDGKVGETEVQKQPIIERIRSYSCSVDDLAIIGGILLFLLLVGIICAFAFTGNSALKSPPLVDGKFIQATTSCGPVEGVYEDSGYAFRGIPYALQPIGDRRFKPAQLIENQDQCWNGTLKAHNATAVCWQSFADGTINGVEDCLNLDVITPYVRYTEPLPVIVLIGADSFNGQSPNKLRPSARIARNRDVVFVRPNFRLSVLGFLATQDLTNSVRPPTSGNYALSDIIAVLKWVQLNIVHFGGNSKQVTLLGHRAGATLVSALITSPKAKNLFARAWVTSGSAHFPGLPLSDYERINSQEYNVKCDEGDCLNKATAEELLESVPDTWKQGHDDLPREEENKSRHDWLVLDGEILQKHPTDVIKAEPDQIPQLVIGTTAHGSHSETLFNKHVNWTAELVREYINDSAIGKKGLTDEVLKRYNATYQGLVQIISDIRTVCPLLTFAQKIPTVPFYVVTQTAGDHEIAGVDDDIQAILGRYDQNTVQQRRYASAITQAFYYYVSQGEFKKGDQQKRVFVIEQDVGSATENYGNCNFWIEKDIVPRFERID